MNNTLTGFGLALVVALIAALIGPWFVNWTAYRDDFAREASAFVGAPVRVAGAVDVRLLPSPYVRFRGLTVGEGATRSSVDEVEVELAIAPLFRGEFKAERVKLVRPRLGVETTADGTVRTAFSNARPGKSAPDAVSFDRAEIADGSIAIAAQGREITIERVAGVAEAGSLVGPYRFEGAAGPAARRVEIRLSTARADAKGQMRVKLSLARDAKRETLDFDGGLAMGRKPAFDGRFAFARAVAKEGEGQEPWRVSGDLKTAAGDIGLDRLDIAYGPDERGLRLSGRGSVKLAPEPRVELALESRQLDLDRIAGENRPRTPAAMLAQFADRFSMRAAPPVAGRVALDLRGVVLAGDVVQDVRIEAEPQAGGWRLAKAAARLPGDTSVSLSGAIAFADAAPGFAGPLDFSTGDLPTLRRWLSGGLNVGVAPARRVAVKGDVTARIDGIAIDEADLTVDGAHSKGRVAWRAAADGAAARMEAALDAEKLDLDALGIDRLVAHVLGDRSTDLVLALDAKELTFAGVRMRDVSIDGASSGEGFELTRLSVRDAGGAQVTGSGRIGPASDGPRGRLSFHVDAPRLAPLLTLGRALGAPEDALVALDRRAAAIAPVKLALDLEAGDDARRLSVDGQAAGGQITARISTAQLSLDAPADAQLKISSSDGRRLAALIGLSLSPAVDVPGGELAVTLSGAPSKGMTGDARLAAFGLDLALRGAVAHAPVAGFSLEGDGSLKAGDLSALAEALGRLTPGAAPRTPADLKGRVSASAEGLRLDAVAGQVGGRGLSGRLVLPADPSAPVDGALAFDDLPAAALGGLLLSPEGLAPGADRRTLWPSGAFGPAPLRGLAGRIDVTAKKIVLAAGQEAADASFTLAMRPGAAALEKISAGIDGGRLTGSIGVARAGEDATVSLALALEGARADRLLGLAEAASPLIGAADLRIEAQGTGRSLAGVMTTLTGTGSAALKGGAIRAFDPAAIDRIEPQVEAGLALDAPRIAEALSRDFGRADLKIARAVAPFTVSGGVVRVGGVTSESEGARLGGGLSFDLRRLWLDADLTLQPARPDGPQVTVSFEGPLAKPVRRIDATSFTGWLSVRAVERETRRIDAMENDIRERAKLARQRADEDRKREEDERRRAEEERKKAEAERKKRDAEARALIDTLPRPQPSAVPGTAPSFDLSPPALTGAQPRPSQPPGGVFDQPAPQRPAAIRPSTRIDMPAPPQSILPPGMVAPADR